MRNIFLQKSRNTKEAKDLLLKVFFNPAKQKEVIIRAAKESAEDQRAMLQKATLKMKSR